MNARGTALAMAEAMRTGDRVKVADLIGEAVAERELLPVVAVLAHLAGLGLTGLVGDDWPKTMALALLDDDLPEWPDLPGEDPAAAGDPDL